MAFLEKTFLGIGLAFIGFLFVGITQVSAQTIPIPTPQEVTELTTRFTIAAPTTFELQHRCQTTKTTNGYGEATNYGSTEIYAEIEIIRE